MFSRPTSGGSPRGARLRLCRNPRGQLADHRGALRVSVPQVTPQRREPERNRAILTLPAIARAGDQGERHALSETPAYKVPDTAHGARMKRTMPPRAKLAGIGASGLHGGTWFGMPGSGGGGKASGVWLGSAMPRQGAPAPPAHALVHPGGDHTARQVLAQYIARAPPRRCRSSPTTARAARSCIALPTISISGRTRICGALLISSHISPSSFLPGEYATSITTGCTPHGARRSGRACLTSRVLPPGVAAVPRGADGLSGRRHGAHDSVARRLPLSLRAARQVFRIPRSRSSSRLARWTVVSFWSRQQVEAARWRCSRQPGGRSSHR
jgi:hypothetical protein